MRLLAIDGNSILNRAYYGVRPLTTKDGLFTNGIYGFLTILLKIEQEVLPDAVAVAFDMRAPTFRHEKFAGYKAQRKGMPDELAQQLPLLQELLGYLGYAIVQKAGWEADDLLGTLAHAAKTAGHECVIATGDRDAFQLVDAGVAVRLAFTKGGRPQSELYTPDVIMQKYGVTPPQLIDIKALQGDASDNIPGVAGVGEKTATALIQQFGSVAKIYEQLESLPMKEGVRTKLADGKELALLSRELAEIDCHAPIEAEAPAYQKGEGNPARAYHLMSNLELFSLMPRFHLQAPAPGSEAAAELKSVQTSMEVCFNTLPDELLESGQVVELLAVFDREEVTALCVAGQTGLYLLDKDIPAQFRQIFTARAKKRTNHLKRLHRYAMRAGIEMQGVTFDAEIAAYILSPTAGDYDLARLLEIYGISHSPIEGVFGAHAELIAQCAALGGLADKLEQEIKKNGQQRLFEEIELPLAGVLAEMEHYGIALDTDGLKAYGSKLAVELEKEQQLIYQLAGEEFNINSPKQLGVILFDKLGLPAKKKTKTGYSTNVDVLEELRDKHPLVGEVLEYRKLAKLKSTYADGLLAVVGKDGRVHTTFQQTLTRTGRISSVEPNMQNIPVRTKLGSELRRFFCAGEGFALLDADYSQIELRVLAHISRDEKMIGAFRAGEDIHRNTASQVLGVPKELITPEMRGSAKAVNFGIVYGIGAFSLAQDIGVSVAEANRYIKGYLNNFSGVRQYMADTVGFGTEHGYVETLLGRRRALPELAASNRNMREFGKRVAMNTPIQGTAADIIKIAMVQVSRRLKREGLRARLILQVHDELIVECPHGEIEAASQILREEMEQALELSVPLVADVGQGKTWLEAK